MSGRAGSVASLRQQPRAAGHDDAVRLVASMRAQLLAQVATLRDEHLKGARELAAKSSDGYRSDALRVAAAGGDPLALAGTRASFRKLRAACLWHEREQLRELLASADRARKAAAKQGAVQVVADAAALAVYVEGTRATGGRNLEEIAQRLEFLSSRLFVADGVSRRHRAKQQRSKLGRLPADWIERMHRRTRAGKYGHAVAVAALIPLRPAEIAQRVRVRLDGAELLFEVQGAKVQQAGSGVARHVQGIGQPLRVIRLSQVDPSRLDILRWMREEVSSNGGRLVVGKALTAGGISSAFRAASAREFPTLKAPPSFYALRHAAAAEVKAAAATDAELVAMTMGHASERSQQAYGMRSQARGGYVIDAQATRAVRPPRPKAGPPARLSLEAKGKSAARGSKLTTGTR